MKPQNELALIVAYYLSRLDKKALVSLGYSTFKEAVDDIGHILDVKPNTVKNMRDEFDYHHQNSRVGWRRELSGSRLKVFQMFQMTDDHELTEIVREIITNRHWTETGSYEDLRLVLKKDRGGPRNARTYIMRGPTGKKAEEYFMKAFDENPLPVSGDLVDCRDFGCGYDFEIKTADGNSSYVEIKGLAGSDGGILLTDKEWFTANKYKDKYYLVVITDVAGKPSVQIIQNPASKLKPIKNIYTTVQVNWSVPKKALSSP